MTSKSLAGVCQKNIESYKSTSVSCQYKIYLLVRIRRRCV